VHVDRCPFSSREYRAYSRGPIYSDVAHCLHTSLRTTIMFFFFSGGWHLLLHGAVVPDDTSGDQINTVATPAIFLVQYNEGTML
jgi:hypothetical protein